MFRQLSFILILAERGLRPTHPHTSTLPFLVFSFFFLLLFFGQLILNFLFFRFSLFLGVDVFSLRRPATGFLILGVRPTHFKAFLWYFFVHCLLKTYLRRNVQCTTAGQTRFQIEQINPEYTVYYALYGCSQSQESLRVQGEMNQPQNASDWLYSEAPIFHKDTRVGISCLLFLVSARTASGTRYGYLPACTMCTTPHTVAHTPAI